MRPPWLRSQAPAALPVTASSDDITTSFAAIRAAPSTDRASVERRTLLAIGGLLLGVWLAIVFAGSLSNADRARAQAAEARQATQLLRDRVSAGLDEIATVQGAAFLAFQASAYGYGRNGERWFALQGSNVALPSIVPLGQQPAAVPAGGSGSWFDLLFGS